jgi:peptidyl-prolyl cis-trans isomerase SurA
MARRFQFGELCKRVAAVWMLVLLGSGGMRGQTAGAGRPTPVPAASVAPPALPAMPLSGGTQLDRVVAIVNGDPILDSDVEQERRFAALLPYGEGGGVYSRDRAIERLINRSLILQQERLQPGSEVGDAAVAKDLESLRKSIPACKQSACETKQGWDSFLATQGFTEASLTELWRQRMEVLAFIELRFRMGIKIPPAQIQSYYDNELRAQFAAQHATPPPLETISSRIEEVLLQQQVSSLLGDWLRSLRAQGSVVVLHPGEEAP